MGHGMRDQNKTLPPPVAHTPYILNHRYIPSSLDTSLPNPPPLTFSTHNLAPHHTLKFSPTPTETSRFSETMEELFILRSLPLLQILQNKKKPHVRSYRPFPPCSASRTPRLKYTTEGGRKKGGTNKQTDTVPRKRRIVQRWLLI
uniref:Uncharacterized protein n=1 Tax=Trypanosoma congolense (strain IL3000) TaxID=1068625 RepID=G0UUL4_TRYCI|nr:hypothetical protein, unlikely [Trypanosoma congolense IL3000]